MLGSLATARVLSPLPLSVGEGWVRVFLLTVKRQLPGKTKALTDID
jgi:hypothetical protein